MLEEKNNYQLITQYWSSKIHYTDDLLTHPCNIDNLRFALIIQSYLHMDCN